MELSVLCLLTLALAFVPQLSATAVPIPRPGCPPYKYLSPQELSVRLCLKECSTDRDCKDNKICCFDGCSNVCVPRRTECTSDWECPEDKKCCKNACGHIGICVTPKKVFAVPKKGFCPTPEGFGICVDHCSTDHDCEKNLKCCSNNCGKTCVEPLMKERKKGICPKPIPHFAECDATCDNHNKCEGDLLCCYSGCGMECLEPVRKITVGWYSNVKMEGVS
uniref:WAP domain-containing protein n=1 Tax=Knipowitschia caucasica TaxID=637954 RepID=A0AAV2LXZ3_KNICA